MPTFFETEGNDRPHMDLPGPQNALIEAVLQANPRTIVVINAGAPVTMPWINRAPAVIEAFYPGQEGGNAVAHVLVGLANPSGKLPVSFPQRYQDNPAYLNYPGSRQVLYGEGIFVGYRYYDYKGVDPLFPFGHGLSYTTFEYSKLHGPTEAQVGEDVQVSLAVKNTGSCTGKEVVQLYVCDQSASLPRPLKELKGFRKVELRPGETRQVEFTLNRRAFAFYDPLKKDWVVEPGLFTILAGSSSRDIRLSAEVLLK